MLTNQQIADRLNELRDDQQIIISRRRVSDPEHVFVNLDSRVCCGEVVVWARERYHWEIEDVRAILCPYEES